MGLYDQLKTGFEKMINEKNWSNESISVRVRTLKPEEAIGNPEDRDYPIIKGREWMIEAEFRGALGQAFTDSPGDFSGTLQQVVDLDLEDNQRRSIFLAALNAVMRHASRVENTIHCKDDAPPVCARQLVTYIEKKYGEPKIAMVGLQPRMVQQLGDRFELRVTDLDEDNIDRTKFDITIGGPEKTAENIEWCDLALITGSTLSNSSVLKMSSGKPTIFFGVTVAGPAEMLDLQRFCPLST